MPTHHKYQNHADYQEHAEALASGKTVVHIGGRSASTPQELEFILAAQEAEREALRADQERGSEMPTDVFQTLSDMQRVILLTADKTALTAEREQLRDRCETQRLQCMTLTAERDVMLAEIDTLTAEGDKLADVNADLLGQVSTLNARIADLEAVMASVKALPALPDGEESLAEQEADATPFAGEPGTSETGTKKAKGKTQDAAA